MSVHRASKKIRKTNGALDRRGDLFAYQLLLPAIILIFLVNIYPFLSGLINSFKNGTLLTGGIFIGFKNYTDVFVMSEFWNSIYFSLIFSFFSVIGSYLVGLGLALLLNKDFLGRGFFRTALLLPWISPSIVSIVSWRWLINDQTSFVNQVLLFFGIGPVLFLADPKWAVASVCVIKIWRSFPFMMLSLLASLQSISVEQYESAHVEGANRWQAFRHITLPNLMPITIVIFILMTIWSFNDYDTIWLLTQGGPVNATTNLIVLAYKFVFSKNSVGIGSTMAIVALIFLMIMAGILLKRQKKIE